MTDVALKAEKGFPTLAELAEAMPGRFLNEPNEERILGHMALAASFVPKGAKDAEDIRQAAFEALVRADRNFDESFGLQFATYAVPSIKGAIKRHYRDTSWGVGVPRSLQESFLHVRKTESELTQTLGRVPSRTEIAEAADMDEAQVRSAQAVEKTAYFVRSLDTPAVDADETLADTLQAPSGHDLADIENVRQAIEGLDERSRRVLTLYFWQGFTQEEIAPAIGVSQVHVSRILRKALDELKIIIADTQD